jgi:hypothetical protein
MAVACSQLLREPEAHTKNLRALLALTVDKDTEVTSHAAAIAEVNSRRGHPPPSTAGCYGDSTRMKSTAPAARNLTACCAAEPA